MTRLPLRRHNIYFECNCCVFDTKFACRDNINPYFKIIRRFLYWALAATCVRFLTVVIIFLTHAQLLSVQFHGFFYMQVLLPVCLDFVKYLAMLLLLCENHVRPKELKIKAIALTPKKGSIFSSLYRFSAFGSWSEWHSIVTKPSFNSKHIKVWSLYDEWN